MASNTGSYFMDVENISLQNAILSVTFKSVIELHSRDKQLIEGLAAFFVSPKSRLLFAGG
jgi:hypothetical protein